ncbi:hypothetical protein PCE1_001383 [Barthelona sp. PCE]
MGKRHGSPFETPIKMILPKTRRLSEVPIKIQAIDTFDVDDPTSETMLIDIRKDIWQFYNQQKFTDFILISSEGTKFHVHRYTLLVHFNVIRVAYELNKDISELCVNLEDVFFPVLISFLYLGETCLSDVSVVPLLQCAVELESSCLIDCCCYFMDRNFDFQSIKDVYMCFENSAPTALQDLLLRAANRELPRLVVPEMFEIVPCSLISKLFDLEVLSVSEDKLFEAMLLSDHINHENTVVGCLMKLRRGLMMEKNKELFDFEIEKRNVKYFNPHEYKPRVGAPLATSSILSNAQRRVLQARFKTEIFRKIFTNEYKESCLAELNNTMKELPVLIIARLSHDGTVVGGYTSVGFKCSSLFEEYLDREAFIFCFPNEGDDSRVTDGMVNGGMFLEACDAKNNIRTHSMIPPCFGNSAFGSDLTFDKGLMSINVAPGNVFHLQRNSGNSEVTNLLLKQVFNGFSNEKDVPIDFMEVFTPLSVENAIRNDILVF